MSAHAKTAAPLSITTALAEGAPDPILLQDVTPLVRDYLATSAHRWALARVSLETPDRDLASFLRHLLACVRPLVDADGAPLPDHVTQAQAASV